MMIALALLAGLQAAPSAPAAAPAQPKPYVSRFCASVALNDVEPGLLRQLYSDWDARAASDVQAQAYRPDSPLTPGQMAIFGDPAAPKVFIEPRRAACSLIYPEAQTPASVLNELKTATVPLHKGSKPTPWSRLANKRLGGGGPVRYFLPTSDDSHFGVCAVIYEDLRLHDGSPATLVQVQTCRLGDDETFDNG